MADAFAQFLTGLASASSLFLVAAGLSIIFGVTRIVNFAHGSFYMLGAYLAVTLAGAWQGALGYWAAVVSAALAVGAIGVAIEATILRRLYRSPELLQLVATFGLVLIIQDAALAIWGPEDILGRRAPGLSGAVAVFGRKIPEYDLFLVALGPAVLGAIWLLLHRTRFGVLVRAATADREMASALGLRQGLLFSGVFFVGATLAGMGGALQLPREPANLMMDLNVIAEAFVVVVIGGMGSILGAYLAAVLIAQVHAFGILWLPEITLVVVFLVMAVVLSVRPYGLLGRPPPPHPAWREAEPPLHPAGPMRRALWLALLGALAGLPLVAGDYTLQVATEVLIFALFAASLHFILGLGGLISFGHAAYFGLGAYGAALLVHHGSLPMEAALVAGPLASAAGALVFGWFCARSSGVYLAMLTLAFAQILWSIAFQWTAVTGGDNGLLRIWPSAWARDSAAYYLLVLALVGLSLYALRRIAFSPFGYALRAGRDAPQRARTLGIPVARVQWIAFVLAGAAAGLGGALYAFLKGSVFPNVLAIPVSVDGLVMVLLGGVHALSGPLLGAAAFTGLKIELASATLYWRAGLGLAILALALLFPRGLLGTWRPRWGRAP